MVSKSHHTQYFNISYYLQKQELVIITRAILGAYLQSENRGDRLVVTDGELHVTAVKMLWHTSSAG